MNSTGIDAAVDDWTEVLHEAVYGRNPFEDLAGCSNCGEEFNVNWEEACGSSLEDEVYFCCEVCHAAWEEKNKHDYEVNDV